jgi:hypothetical protein
MRAVESKGVASRESITLAYTLSRRTESALAPALPRMESGMNRFCCAESGAPVGSGGKVSTTALVWFVPCPKVDIRAERFATGFFDLCRHAAFALPTSLQCGNHAVNPSASVCTTNCSSMSGIATAPITIVSTLTRASALVHAENL